MRRGYRGERGDFDALWLDAADHVSCVEAPDSDERGSEDWEERIYPYPCVSM